MRNFEEIIDSLQEHLEFLYTEINKSDYKSIEKIENTDGIYVFYENEVPVYVGRTNRKRMKKRIKEHYAPYSNKNSASFAFRIVNGLKNDRFKESNAEDEFLKAKERVSKMQVKTIEIHDPIIQTIFEPYLAFKLNTIEKYNSFHTH